MTDFCGFTYSEILSSCEFKSACDLIKNISSFIIKIEIGYNIFTKAKAIVHYINHFDVTQYISRFKIIMGTLHIFCHTTVRLTYIDT